MNIAVICNIVTNMPICAIVHDYTKGDIGYSTYDDDFSIILDIILDNKIYSKNKINNLTEYNDNDINNQYYLYTLNDFLPDNYKITYIQKVTGNINSLLEKAYELLNTEETQ